MREFKDQYGKLACIDLLKVEAIYQTDYEGVTGLTLSSGSRFEVAVDYSAVVEMLKQARIRGF